MSCPNNQQSKKTLADTWKQNRGGVRLIDLLRPQQETSEAGLVCIRREMDWIERNEKSDLVAGQVVSHHMFTSCKQFTATFMQVLRDEGLIVEKMTDSVYDFKMYLPK